MTKLLNLKSVRNSSNTKAPRERNDECEIQIRNLKSLGVKSDLYVYLIFHFSAYPNKYLLNIPTKILFTCVKRTSNIFR